MQQPDCRALLRRMAPRNHLLTKAKTRSRGGRFKEVAKARDGRCTITGTDQALQGCWKVGEPGTFCILEPILLGDEACD